LVISSCFLFQLFYFVFNFNIFDILTLFFSGEFSTIVYSETIVSLPYFNPSSFVNGYFYAGQLNADLDVTSIYFEKVFYFKPLPGCFYLNGTDFSYELTNAEVLGWLVYTYTFFIFMVISLILLISMIGSIILVLNQNINIKRQVIFRQTLRALNSSVSLKN
jgi:hypothetical protein